MSDVKKCAHSLCSCLCTDGKTYCSQICEDSASLTSLACDCNHPGCRGSVAAL